MVIFLFLLIFVNFAVGMVVNITFPQYGSIEMMNSINGVMVDWDLTFQGKHVCDNSYQVKGPYYNVLSVDNREFYVPQVNAFEMFFF